VEGKNIAIESRHAGGQNERLAALADELIALMVDVILAVNTSAAQAAKKATAAIPIVITRVADPVKSGLVASMSRPGGNITGLSFLPEALSAKQLQLLKEALPRVSRVATMSYAGNPGAAITVKGMEAASAQLGLQLLRVSVQNPGDFLGAFETAARNRAEALVVVDDAMVTRYRVEILRLAEKHSLPVVSLYKPFVEAGGLIAYGASALDMYRRAADYVAKILKGAKPADLPIEQPTKFELIINLRTAKALGLTIPPSLLARADQVLE
jgi:putative ABC transport system substrate-binding protein